MSEFCLYGVTFKTFQKLYHLYFIYFSIFDKFVYGVCVVARTATVQDEGSKIDLNLQICLSGYKFEGSTIASFACRGGAKINVPHPVRYGCSARRPNFVRAESDTLLFYERQFFPQASMISLHCLLRIILVWLICIELWYQVHGWEKDIFLKAYVMPVAVAAHLIFFTPHWSSVLAWRSFIPSDEFLNTKNMYWITLLVALSGILALYSYSLKLSNV